MEISYDVRFFIGKGGVGKTTTAVAYSLMKAEEGKNVLIVSLDPAHNLGDVLKEALKDEPRQVYRNLWAAEVDFDKMVRKYMDELADEVKDIYGYLKIFNLEGYVDTLKYSPGIEEHATLEKIKEILKKNTEESKYDIIVFDTPPTGLTVRIMALPKVTLIWLDKLIDLRLAILGRRKMLSKALGEPLKVNLGGKMIEVATDPEDDPIYKELEKMKEETSWVNGILTDSRRCSVVMVVNPEVLPVVEAERAAVALRSLNVPVTHLVVNKVLNPESVGPELKELLRQQEDAMKLINEKFAGLKIIKIPMLPWEPVGIEKIKSVTDYLKTAF
jgi:arsenite-transporting ATPase